MSLRDEAREGEREGGEGEREGRGWGGDGGSLKWRERPYNIEDANPLLGVPSYQQLWNVFPSAGYSR